MTACGANWLADFQVSLGREAEGPETAVDCAANARHADAHNHLGIVSLEARKLKAAEQHFRAAIDGGQRHLERDGAKVAWGRIENRRYLRGLANLALVLAEQKKWAEALAIHKQMLKLNPNDNQGVRYLIGPECLRVGDNDGAIHIAAQADLWQAVPRGAELLRFWWAAPPVATWRRKLDDIMLRLRDLAPFNERSSLVSEWSTLRSDETVQALVRALGSAS